MRISGILNSFNNQATIQQALESLESEGLLSEVLAIDDHSSDDTWNFLKNREATKNITIMQTSKNSGPSKSRNLGVTNANCEYMAFLDGDDYWLDDRLQKTLDAAKNTGADVVFTDAYFEIDGKLTKKRQSSVMPPSYEPQLLEHLFRRNCINMCAVLMKTSLAKKVLFDESIRSAEDYDFWLRVAATGAKFTYIDEPLVVYRKTSGSLSNRRLLSVDSTLEVLKKDEALAKTKLAKENLRLQRIDLYIERLDLIDPRGIKTTLQNLHSLRPLGKRESITYKCSLLGSLPATAARKILLS